MRGEKICDGKSSVYSFLDVRLAPIDRSFEFYVEEVGANSEFWQSRLDAALRRYRVFSDLAEAAKDLSNNSEHARDCEAMEFGANGDLLGNDCTCGLDEVGAKLAQLNRLEIEEERLTKKGFEE